MTIISTDTKPGQHVCWITVHQNGEIVVGPHAPDPALSTCIEWELRQMPSTSPQKYRYHCIPQKDVPLWWMPPYDRALDKTIHLMKCRPDSDKVVDER